MRISAMPLWAVATAFAAAASASAQQSWLRVEPSNFTFEQVSFSATPLSEPGGNLAVELNMVFRITNDSAETVQAVRWVWPWGIGFHLYADETDQIFERRWDETLGEFVFYGQDAWYDGRPEVSLTPVAIDGLMGMAETNLSATADASDFPWLGVNDGAVPAVAYPGLSVDPDSQVPYYELGTLAPGGSVEFAYGAWLEYPNNPAPSQVGFYGLAELIHQVPEPSACLLMMGARCGWAGGAGAAEAGLTLVRARINRVPGAGRRRTPAIRPGGNPGEGAAHSLTVPGRVPSIAEA